MAVRSVRVAEWPWREAAAAALAATVAAAVLVGSPATPPLPSLPVMDFSHPAEIDGRSDELLRYVVTYDPTVNVVRAAPAFASEGLAGLLTDQDRAALAELEAAELDASLRLDPDVPLASSTEGARLQGAGLDGATAADVATLLANLDEVAEASPLAPGLVAVRTSLSAEALAAIDGVISVEEDIPLGLASNDAEYGRLWGLHNIGQTVRDRAGVPGVDIGYEAVGAVADGTGVVVAVIDSGIDLDHPDLAANVWTNDDEVCDNGTDDDGNGYVDDCQGWDFINNDPTVDDPGSDNGHGTHVAGTIAGVADNTVGVAGVAPNARIMSLKVQDGGSFPSSRAAAAIRYAVDNGATLMNLSWGGQPGGPSSPAIADAIAYADQHGVLVVAAAGNSGVNNDVSPVYPASYANGNVVAVAAHDNQGNLANFSNHGVVSVDLAAPGVDIVSAVPGGGYGFASGTSMAAPHVAGVAALVADHLDTADAATIRAALLGNTIIEDAFLSRVSSGGRLSAPRSLGIREGGVSVTVDGVDGLTETEPVVLDLVMNAIEIPTDTPLQRRLTLGFVHGSSAVGVVGHPMTIDADGVVAETATTVDALLPIDDAALDSDDIAELEGPGWSASVTTRLPAGRYVLLAELVEVETLRTFGAPQVAVFDVAGVAEPEPAPGQDTPETDDAAAGEGGVTVEDEPLTPPSGGVVALPVMPLPPPASAPDGGGGVVIVTSPGGTATSPSGGGGGGGVVVPVSPTSPTTDSGSSGGGGAVIVEVVPVPAPTGDDSPTSGGGGVVVPDTPTTATPAPDEPTSGGGGVVVVPDGDNTGDDERVWPHQGPVSGMEIVKIRAGNLPEGIVVWFGDSRAAVELVAPWFVLVRTSAHPAGLVDVRITGPGGFELVIPDAYTFVPDRTTGAVVGAPDTPLPTAPRGDADGGTGVVLPPANDVEPTRPSPPPTGGGAVPPRSVDDGPVDDGPADDGPTDGDAVAPTDPEPVDEGLRRGTIGRSFDHDNGLTLDPFERDEPLRGVPVSVLSGRVCPSSPCVTVSI